jgi:hypothetical protein
MAENKHKKMREALVKARKAICHHAEHVCQSLAWENSTINANCGDMLCAHRDLCEAKTAIDVALSEPERNCDLFESPKNETDEQEQKIWDAYNKWCNNPRNRNIVNFPIHSIVGWLLAPATERKGEVK